MAAPVAFDLSAYLSEKFPSLSLAGDLFHSWPLSIRFEMGIERFRERAPRLYESVFPAQHVCTVISQDRPENTLSLAADRRSHAVFLLPGVFDCVRLSALQRLAHTNTEGDESILQWAQLPARSFSYKAVFESIANFDHARTPSVSSRVYFLNQTTDTLLHMYDDRGLDIIAAAAEPLMGISREYHDWILENRGFTRSRCSPELR